MSDEPAVERLVESVLQNRGLLPLELLLARFVPVGRLRALAQERGTSPKGFRIEAASASALAQALLRDLDPDALSACAAELVAVLRAGASAPARQAPRSVSPEPTDRQPPARAAEVERLEARLAAAVAAQQRVEARAADLESRSAHLAQEVARLRGDLIAAEARPAPTERDRAADRDLERRLHAAESEVEVMARSEEDYRRRLAEQQSAIRVLEQRLEELEELVPKNRRRRPPPAPPPAIERFRIPHFTADFYRSLGGRDQRSIEAAFDAIWRFATSGYGYPGLEVKQLEGIDLWSMRAGIKVRVYFRPRSDGDVDILAVGDREDQDTLLRRLR